MTSKAQLTVTLPIDCTIYAGVAADCGTARYSYGFDAGSKTIYSIGTNYSANCQLIVVGKC